MSPDADRIRRVFEEALERSGEERAAFLDEACAGDAEMRREVESLLEAESGMGSFLGGDGIAASLNEALADDDALVGRTLGRYRVPAHLPSIITWQNLKTASLSTLAGTRMIIFFATRSFRKLPIKAWRLTSVGFIIVTLAKSWSITRNLIKTL